MKKTLLLLSILAGGFAANAQCTPDPLVTSGISPDTATGLNVAYTGQSYSQVITFVVPQDTTVSGATVTIDRIDLDAVTGLPTNFTYGCNPASCSFAGGTSGCVDLYSTTDPTTPQIGSYPLTIETTPYVLIFGSPVSQGTTTYDGYYLVIEDGATAGLSQVQEGQMKSLIAYPNPTSGNTTIEFAMGYSSEVVFNVTNLLGEVVETQKLAATKGLNTIQLDASAMPNGIYLYTISDGKNSIAKKLTVNK